MKISPLTVILIGVCFMLVVLSYAYFDNYVPNKAEADSFEKYAAALQVEADKTAQAQKRVTDARAIFGRRKAEWQAIVEQRTPPMNVKEGGIDLGVPPDKLGRDAKEFRNTLQAIINKQIKVGGVSVANGPVLPVPADDSPTVLAGFFNYPTIPFPVVVQDLGAITVQGTYKQIMANMRSWSHMPRMVAMADALHITGTSPNLTGTYHVTILVFIRGNTFWPQAPVNSFVGPNGGTLKPVPVAPAPAMPGAAAPAKPSTPPPAVRPGAANAKGAPAPVRPGPAAGGPQVRTPGKPAPTRVGAPAGGNKK